MVWTRYAPPIHVAASLNELERQYTARFPNRPKASDGALGNADHAARASDHNPCWTCTGASEGVIRAVDLTTTGFTTADAGKTSLTEKQQRDTIAALIRAEMSNKVDRIHYIIHRFPGDAHTFIWSRTSTSVAAWQPKHYDLEAAMPHDHHFHVSLMHTAAADADTSAWFDWGVVPAPAPPPAPAPIPKPPPIPAPAPAPAPAPPVPAPRTSVVANIPLGATLTGLTSLRWALIQGMQPFDWQGHTHWLVAQASHLDTLFHHYDQDGKLRDTMRLVAGGHCSQFAARVVNGKLRVWTYDGLGNVYRIVYRPGNVTVKSTDVTRAANLKGAVAARWDQNVIATRTVASGKWTFRRYQVDDVVAKAAPVVQKWFRIPVTDVFQGFAVDAKHCHVLLGATSKPRRIVTYEWDGDQVAQKPVETRDITALKVTKSLSTEPEGLFWVGDRLGVGIREGGLNPSRIITGHLL